MTQVDWERLTKSLEDASKAQDDSLTSAVADRLVGSVMDRAISDVASPPATRDLAAIVQSSQSSPAVTPQAMQWLDSLDTAEVPADQLPTSKRLFAAIDKTVNGTTAATREGDILYVV